MESVAAPAIRGDGGSILSGETVVAFEECFHAVARQAIFGVELLRCVAFAADFLRNLQAGSVFQSLNPVFRMTIGADWRIAFSGARGLPMNAGFHISSFLIMTAAACFRLAGEVQWRYGRIRWQYFMRVVAILTRCSIGLSGF